MLSRGQIIFIKSAQKHAGLDDAAWRLLLWNVAKVRSSKDLDDTSFEDVMAALEDMGFRDTKRDGDFWRRKVAGRSGRANERQIALIERLARSCRYSLPQLCERFSDGRTQFAEKLTPKEAWNLIEMLKSVNRREAVRNGAGDYARGEQLLFG